MRRTRKDKENILKLIEKQDCILLTFIYKFVPHSTHILMSYASYEFKIQKNLLEEYRKENINSLPNLLREHTTH